MRKAGENLILGDIRLAKKKSLAELKKQPEIHDFMKQYHLNDEKLGDYWAELLGYAEDSAECANCSSLASCPKVTKGMRKALRYDGETISTTLSYCAYGRTKEKENKILQHFLYNNISSRMALRDLKETKFVTQAQSESQEARAALMAVYNYIKKPSYKGLYIYGRSGTGKTTLMAALLNQLAQAGYDVGMLNMTAFLYEMKSSFNSYNDDSYLSRVLDIPYLLLDGIGDENVTPWSRDEILGTILAYRAVNELPTFFTSTFSLAELKKAYVTRVKDKTEALRSERIADKIRAMSTAYHLT